MRIDNFTEIGSFVGCEKPGDAGFGVGFVCDDHWRPRDERAFWFWAFFSVKMCEPTESAVRKIIWEENDLEGK